MSCHGLDLTGRYLVGVPGDQRCHMQPVRWHQVKAWQASQAFLAERGQPCCLRFAAKAHEPHQQRSPGVCPRLQHPVIFHQRRKGAHRSSLPRGGNK